MTTYCFNGERFFLPQLFLALHSWQALTHFLKCEVSPGQQYRSLSAQRVLLTSRWHAVVCLWCALSAVSCKFSGEYDLALVSGTTSLPISNIILELGTPAGQSVFTGRSYGETSSNFGFTALASLNWTMTLRLVSSLCWPLRYSQVQDDSHRIVFHLESGWLGGQRSVLADKNSVSSCLSCFSVCSVSNPSDSTWGSWH